MRRKMVEEQRLLRHCTDEELRAELLKRKPAPQQENKPPATNELGFDDKGRQLHAAVCCECNKPTTVPFKPFSGSKISCKDCYANRSMR